MLLDNKEYYITLERMLAGLENKNEDELVDLPQEQILSTVILLQKTYVELNGLGFRAEVSNHQKDLRLIWSNNLGSVTLNVSTVKTYNYINCEYYRLQTKFNDTNYEITSTILSKYLLKLIT